jgi:hypothetical protein
MYEQYLDPPCELGILLQAKPGETYQSSVQESLNIQPLIFKLSISEPYAGHIFGYFDRFK